MAHAESVLLEQVVLRGNLAELVRNAETFDSDGMLLGENLADRPAQAAEDALVLDRDHAAGLLRRCDQRGLIEGLHRRIMQHVGLDPVLGQLVGGFQHERQHVAGRDERDVLALAHHLGRVRIEDVVVVEDLRAS